MKKVIIYIGLVCLGTVIGVKTRPAIDQVVIDKVENHYSRMEVIAYLEDMIEYLHWDTENGDIDSNKAMMYIETLEMLVEKVQ